MRNPVSRFAYSQSSVGLSRSKFDRSQRHLTTMSAGLLYPLLVDEVLPGDTYSVDMSSLVRMSTPIHPVMDNCYLDVYFFYSSNRIVFDHWKEFMGESPSDPYINPIEYQVPMFTIPESGDIGVPEKSILDYMGIPPRTLPKEFSQLPVRHFCKVWNEWFRDQNLQNAINLDTGDSNVPYITAEDEDFGANLPENFGKYVVSAARGGDLPPVNKYHDYFTSALKEPQKGDPVPIPLSGFAPVYGSELIDVPYSPIITIAADGNPPSDGLFTTTDSGGNPLLSSVVDGSTGEIGVSFSNLGADLSQTTGIYATISDLRYAFQLQKFLEADNRGGTRYREILKQHFNVTSPDATQQIPEFLGGKRIPINMAQVLQTSATNDVSPQGNTAAYSLTTDKFSAFTKSFTEHGYLLAVGCIRTEHSYAQGLEKFWSRKNKFDFYFPEFANISEQPIYNREIYLGDSRALDYDPDLQDGIFGYQEAWADYRYKPNRVSGEFRPTYQTPLDSWHYADYYTSQPYLSDEWIAETRDNIDRTLAVDSSTADQFICDFYFKLNTVRVMPVYSIPGLADHH